VETLSIKAEEMTEAQVRSRITEIDGAIEARKDEIN
jgi:hypothetical protein